MNAKRIIATAVKEENLPVIIHDPNAGPDEPQYTYAAYTTADEDEAAVASLEHHDILTSTQEVVIDENGQALTIQQLVENTTVEEVEAIEEADGTHTIFHIVPADTDLHSENEANLSPGESLSSRSKTFYCTNCGNCYGAAGSLKLHMRACLRQKQEVPPEERKCEICNRVFNSVTYLKEHVLRHTGEGPQRCTRCYRKFVDEKKYRAHMETHKQQDKLEAEAASLSKMYGGKKVVVKQFTCSFCSENFNVIFDMGQVKRRYACDACREKYSNTEQLKRHKQMVEDKREFQCDNCGRKFVFEGFLQRHRPTCDGTIKRRRDMK